MTSLSRDMEVRLKGLIVVEVVGGGYTSVDL